MYLQISFYVLRIKSEFKSVHFNTATWNMFQEHVQTFKEFQVLQDRILRLPKAITPGLFGYYVDEGPVFAENSEYNHPRQSSGGSMICKLKLVLLSV